MSERAFATDIMVRHRQRDGWSVYTCEALPGLLVASRDGKKAYDDLPAAIAALYKADHGVEVSVAHKLGYDEFVAQLSLFMRAHEAVAGRTDALMQEATMIPFVAVARQNQLHS